MDAFGHAGTGGRGVTLAGALSLLIALLAAAGCQARDRNAPSASWETYARMVDAALAENDVTTATRALLEGELSARRSRQWEAMLTMGKLNREVGDLTGRRFNHVTRARDDYRLALAWAHAQRSVDGLLQVARAFAALGDRDVVDQCVRIAADVARRKGDPDALARVEAFRDRWIVEAQVAEPGRPR